MSFAAGAVLAVHYALVLMLCLYGAHRVYHVVAARRLGEAPPPPAPLAGTDVPRVTVQLPMYNEKFVAARIIDAACALDYPADRMQIQVIDDSDDESADIVAACVARYSAAGLDIDHVRRADRTGYKAGALAAAMPNVTGEFIAIFDADFLPEPDFLRRTLASFDDPSIGLVQTRWTFLNSTKSILTRLQTLMLDAHFGIEQLTRHRLGVFFNFNGTAGIWRKAAIADSGGWAADTLTEDTDLSYRAQMRGWRFVYRPDIGCPSEIPEDMGAFKVQQHRWAKGTIEVMTKLLPTIWRSDIPVRNKVEATFHLTANLSYLLMIVDSLFFLLPSVHIRQGLEGHVLDQPLVWLDLPIFAFASLSHAWFFLEGHARLGGRLRTMLPVLPVLLATSIGLSVNNGRAVIEALAKHRTGFVRTPKQGSPGALAAANSLGDRRMARLYRSNPVGWATGLELALGFVYIAFLLWAVAQQYWLVVPFLALFSAGFLFTGLTGASGLLTRSRPRSASRTGDVEPAATATDRILRRTQTFAPALPMSATPDVAE